MSLENAHIYIYIEMQKDGFLMDKCLINIYI